MNTAPSSRYWSDLNWLEFADGAARDWIAVLPLAAIEQHGPHLPLGTDLMIAETLVRAAVAKLPASLPAVFLPVQAVTLSTEHVDFPGTLTLPPDITIQSWLSIGESVARAGVRKLVIVSSHGGNSPAMSIVAQELRARLGMLVVTTGWLRFGTPDGLFTEDEIRHGVHGGAIETSLMLAARPDLVVQDEIDDFPSAGVELAAQFRHLSTGRPAPFAWQAQDLNAAGAIGNAAQGTAEKGKALIAHAANAFGELLGEVHAFDPDQLRGSPELE